MPNINHYRFFFCFFLGFLAVYVPYVYLPGMTEEKGISGASTAFIISLIGVSNTVGRVVIGALGQDHLVSFRHSKHNGAQHQNVDTPSF
jgi:predicted MFS family arabinose efflux permease